MTHLHGRRWDVHAMRVTTRRRAPARRRRLAASLANVVIGVSVLGACSTASPPVPASCTTTPATPGTAHASATVPHIMVLVMENESYDQLIGSRAAPYVNSLASSYVRATCSYASVDPAGILRTVEEAYGLSYLGAAAQARSGSLPILTDKPRP